MAHLSQARRAGLCRLALVVAALAAAQPASAASYTLIAPYGGAGTQTSVLAINDAGFMAGSVSNPDTSSSGFIRSPGGVYTLFGDGDFATLGRGINAANQVTGYSYVDATLNLTTANEFRRDADGTITRLANPDTGVPLHGIAQGINTAGVIVGDSYTRVAATTYRHGYILDGAGYTDLSVSPDFRVRTVGRGINDAGLVVGWVFDGTSGVTQGFVYGGGAFLQFVTDPSPTNAATTYLEAVNDNGLASGEWFDIDGFGHPFLYDTISHAFTELHPPGPGNFNAFGLNDLGQVVLTGDNGINYLYDPAGVPEPAAWSLLLTGFGLAGAALRRRTVAPA